jgi:hypothetical protein
MFTFLLQCTSEFRDIGHIPSAERHRLLRLNVVLLKRSMSLKYVTGRTSDWRCPFVF